jgi:glycosyltransferase involved in cell wall biosynthesis
LEYFYTDLWAGGTMWQAIGSLLGRPMLQNRYHEDLFDARVESFDITTSVDSVFGGNLKKNPYEWFLYVGSDFGRSVEESLSRKKGLNWKETIFFGYDTGFLEPAQFVKSRGGKAIVCQMDPSRFEVDLVKEEEKIWPGWAKRLLEVPESYFKRREEEWKVADLVMVNSEWSRQALIGQGVNVGKIIVVPLAYDPNVKSRRYGEKAMSQPTKTSLQDSWSSVSSPNPNLRVLFLGQVILRKGIQYLIEAAKILCGEAVQFDVVGPIGISEEAIKSAPDNMIFCGPISRKRAPEFFAKADLFVLPTLSDGFALTQIEAMAYGLPVITTQNCGDVVSDGVDGMIVRARDGVALAEAIYSLIQDSDKLKHMKQATLAKVRQFTLPVLSDNLNFLELLIK